MPNPLEQIKNRIWGKKQPPEEGELIIKLHHLMMRKYGWIPFEEFKQLPLPTFWNLANCLKEEIEAEERDAEKLKGRKR